jgi:hypothetical protein
MRIRGKTIEAVEPDDIKALLENRVSESQTLEYKSCLPGTAPEDRRDFVADISALANTAGGVIIYGVATERDERGQDTGLPREIVGVVIDNLDQEVLRLTQLVHDGLSPSMAARIRLKTITIDTKTVLLCGVSRSIAGPHMVMLQGIRRFWRRSTAGNYQPDVTELRRMFLESQSWTDEAQEFRRKRLDLIQSLQAHPMIDVTNFVLLEILPLGRLNEMIDLRAHAEAMRMIKPPGASGWDHRFNADGFTTYARNAERAIRSYVQWFRFGGMEVYWSGVVRPGTSGKGKLFAAGAVGEVLTNYVKMGTESLQGILGRDLPYVILFSLHGVRGASIPEPYGFFDEHQIERDDMVLPPVTLEEQPQNLDEVLLPILDVLWQSAGFGGAPRRRQAQ